MGYRSVEGCWPSGCVALGLVSSYTHTCTHTLLDIVAHTCNPNTWEAKGRRTPEDEAKLHREVSVSVPPQKKNPSKCGYHLRFLHERNGVWDHCLLQIGISCVFKTRSGGYQSHHSRTTEEDKSLTFRLLWTQSFHLHLKPTSSTGVGNNKLQRDRGSNG